MYWLSFFKKHTTALFCRFFLKSQTLLLSVFQQCTLSCRKSQNNSFLNKTVRIPEFGTEPETGSLQRFETSYSDILIVLHQSISARPKEYKIRTDALVYSHLQQGFRLDVFRNLDCLKHLRHIFIWAKLPLISWYIVLVLLFKDEL